MWTGESPPVRGAIRDRCSDLSVIGNSDAEQDVLTVLSV